MTININKTLEMAHFFLSKENTPFHKNRLNHLMLLADIESMSRFILPISDDFISCFPHGPFLTTTASYMNGLSISDKWNNVIKSKDYYLAELMNPNTDFEYKHLNKTELNMLDYVWTAFGDLSDKTLSYFVIVTAKEWHKDHDFAFNPTLFFQSLNFSESEVSHRKKYYFEHMLEGKHSLHDILDKLNNKLKLTMKMG